jgi:hypothetical protein
MRKLCVLAAASAFLFGLSSTAGAAPVQVTYAIAPGGTISWTPSGAGSPGSGNNGGQMVIVYTSGSPTLGGTLGTAGSMQIIQLSFVNPGTFFGGPIAGMGVGAGAPGTRTAGGDGYFVATSLNKTYIPVGAFQTTPSVLPPIPVFGTASIMLGGIGAITISLNGIGVQTFSGLPQTFAWTMSGLTGQEISRAVIPEPGTGVLLLGSLAGLAFVARRIRR